MEIYINANLDGAARKLATEHIKQIPFAARLALNSLAFRIAKRRLPRETQRRFLGGSVRWTKQGFEYIKSNKRTLVATIRTRDSRQYLALQILGGVNRPDPDHALTVPSKHSRKTKEGNVSRKMRANYLKRTGNSRIYGIRKGMPAFIGTPKGHPGAPYGIWMRQKYRIKLLLEFDQEAIRYRKRFKFYKYAKDEFHRYFDNEFAVALQRAIGG